MSRTCSSLPYSRPPTAVRSGLTRAYTKDTFIPFGICQERKSESQATLSASLVLLLTFDSCFMNVTGLHPVNLVPYEAVQVSRVGRRTHTSASLVVVLSLFYINLSTALKSTELIDIDRAET